jgi:hypothetical protein
MGSFSGTECWRNTFKDPQARAAEIGKKLPVIQEVTAEDLRNAEDEMPVRNLLEHIHAQPFPEFDHSPPMAGRTDMAARAGECQEVFMAAVFTFHTGKAVVQIAAIEIAIEQQSLPNALSISLNRPHGSLQAEL